MLLSRGDLVAVSVGTGGAILCGGGGGILGTGAGTLVGGGGGSLIGGGGFPLDGPGAGVLSGLLLTGFTSLAPSGLTLTGLTVSGFAFVDFDLAGLVLTLGTSAQSPPTLRAGMAGTLWKGTGKGTGTTATACLRSDQWEIKPGGANGNQS